MKETDTSINFLATIFQLDAVPIILVFCFLFLWKPLYTQENLPPSILEYRIQTVQSIQQLPPLSWMIQEGVAPLTIQEVLSGNFKDANVINNITSEQTIAPFEKYWFALSINSEFPINNWLLFLKEKWYRANYIKGYPDVSVYFTKGEKLLYTGKTGSEIPASQRDIETHSIMSLININCSANEDLLLWVALSNNELERPIPELYLYDSAVNFSTFEKGNYISFGLSLGMTLILLLISSFLWYWIREDIYGWFVIILSLRVITILLVSNEEWLVARLFPEHGYLRFRVAIFLSLALRVFLLHYGRVFLNLSKSYPKLDILFKRLIWVTIFGLGSIGLFFPRGDLLSLNVWGLWTVLLVVYSIVICTVCIKLIFAPNSLAQIYGVGAGLFFSTPVLGPLFHSLGISQVFFNPEILAPIGYDSGYVIWFDLSFLGGRIRVLKRFVRKLTLRKKDNTFCLFS